MLSRIRKNDTVVVLSGKDKGKRGQVISVNSQKETVLIKDVAVVTRHVKARKAGEKSGIIREEGFVSLTKIMPVCPLCKKACRIQVRFLEGNKKTRSCHRCKESF